MQTIKQLPDNVLIEVFSYLNEYSLKSTTLVCKQWNDIIGASPKLMKIFKLRLKKTYGFYLDELMPWEEIMYDPNREPITWSRKLEQILSLKRSYQSMYIFWNAPSETVLKVTAKHGSQIRNFSTYKGKILKASDFQELLQHMPLLEYLKVSQIEFDLEAGEIETIYPAQLKKLQTLKIRHETSWTIFRYLVGAQPKYLDVSMVDRVESDEGTQSLMEFLKAAKCLETLIFDEVFIHNIFQLDESQHLFFQLKSLSFSSQAFIDDGEITTRFCKFLKANTPSLDDLVIRHADLEILEAVFNHIKNIKRLKLTTGMMPDEDFYEKLTPMKSLEELECSGNFPNVNAAKALLGICPNIRSLKVSREYVISDLIAFMLTYNPNIESLKIDNLKNEIEGEARFKALKLLYVGFLYHDESLRLILRNNPTIETIGLRIFADIDIVDFLLSMPNIKHLKFGGEIFCMKNIFDKVVAAEVQHLETLEFIFETATSRPRVLFKMPTDCNEWETKCSYLKEAEKDYVLNYNHFLDF